MGSAYAIAIGVTVVFQLSCFLVAYTCKFDKITDLAGCANFIVIAIGTLLLAPQPLGYRSIVLTALVCASRFQLGSYLFYRVLKRGRDSRFDEVRENFALFLFFWVWQILWVFITCLGLMYVNALGHVADPALGAWDVAGWAIFALGFTLQVSADMIKQRFRSNPENKMKVCDVGPWRYSRHPNFCGEVVMWWGVFVCGVPVFRASPTGWATVAAPLFTMFILLCFTGIPQAEGKASERWYDGGEAQRCFEIYFASTPPLFLCPPQIYRRMPRLLKRVLCFELPSYEYRKSKATLTTPLSVGAAPPNSQTVHGSC